MEIKNKCEIKVVGLRRSGNHAIINWIMAQCFGTVCFLNDIDPDGNPFLSYQGKKLKGRKKRSLLSGDRLKLYIMGGGLFNPLRAFGGEGRKLCKKLTSFTLAALNKDFLLYSYENRPLKEIAQGKVEKFHDRSLGKSLHRFDILVLRDPFNMVASMLKKTDKTELKKYREASITNARLDLWKEYAREFLGLTNYLTNNKLVISFNKWTVNRQYRRSLAEKIGLKFTDHSMSSVSEFGKGSSFDGLKFNGQADKMKVLERWKEFETDEFYKNIFQDEEVAALSKEIFGDIIYA